MSPVDPSAVAADAPKPEPASAPAPHRRRPLRWALAALVVAALVGGGLWWWSDRPSTTAEDTALGYFRALAAGDINAVRASGLQVDTVTAAAYATASGMLGQPKVISSKTVQGGVQVRIGYSMAGRKLAAEVVMIREGDHWTAKKTPTGNLRVESAWGTITVGGVPLDTPSIDLLPAVYPIAAGPSALISGAARIGVVAGAEQVIVLEPGFTTKAEKTAADRVDSYLEYCTRPATAIPENCGISVPWAADLATMSEVRFRIEKAPTLKLTPPGFSATGGVLVATVTGTDPNGAPATKTYRSDAWALRGQLDFAPDGFTIAVD